MPLPYVWFWRQRTDWGRAAPPRVFDRDRKGELCTVLARGAMNSALIEFDDGYRVVTSRSGLRRPNWALALMREETGRP